MNSALSELQGLHCFVHLDDIVIYASSLEQYTKIEINSYRLRIATLKLQPD